MTKMRNFALHITPVQKQALKKLADNSGMTLTRYIEHVLNDAVKDRAMFKTETYRINESEKRKAAVRAF